MVGECVGWVHVWVSVCVVGECVGMGACVCVGECVWVSVCGWVSVYAQLWVSLSGS